MANFPTQRANESAQAYEAACAYFAMGADRSMEHVSQKLSKSVPLLKRWSAQHEWVARSREYDAALAVDIAAEHTARHLADLEAHRKKSMEAGQALYAVAGQLIKQLNYVLANPKKIEGKDGKIYTLHAVDMTASTFGIAARALTTALDLEAHALGVDRILTNDSEQS